VTILGYDEFWLQGYHVLVSGSNNDRGDCVVKVGSNAVGGRPVGTILTMDLLRREIPKTVQGNVQVTVERTKTRPALQLLPSR
jgi:hypothetical protein